MKTVFITCYHSFISRNIFNSDVLNTLKKHKELRIIILAPSNKKDFLERYYGGKNIIIESFDLDEAVKRKYSKFWYRLAFLLQNTNYVQDQRKERLFNHRNLFGYLNYFLVNTVAEILSRLGFARKIYRFFDFLFSPKNFLQEYLNKYSPLLIFSTDIFSEHDSFILREAKAKEIPVIGMVRSWDNTTTKGALRVFPNFVIVNSPQTKKELHEFHSYPLEKIFVVGLPQFDNWLNGSTLSKQEFFKKIGADINKKLILFSPAGNALSNTDWQICQILKDGVKDGFLPSDIQFLIRNHPAHPADFSNFEPDGHFIIESPGTKFKEGKETEIGPDDQSHLLNSVYYSDVVIYIATSLGLDATIFDKPQIIASFDGWEKKPYVKSVKRYHNEDNLRSLIVLGGTRVVESKEDLFLWIRKYLENPEIDREGRKRIIENHLYKIDGKAGERIADFILKFIKEILLAG